MEYFDILRQPLCYVTFETSDSLINCSKCKCAWYSNSETQSLHLPIHDLLCNEPDFEAINDYSLEQCYQLLLTSMKSLENFDYNTATVLVRFQHLAMKQGMKPQNKRSALGKTLNDVGCEFKESIRTLFSSEKCPEIILKHLWACPGLPQFLLLGDMQSLTFYGLKIRHPNGRPLFNNNFDEKAFEVKFNSHLDTSGEWLGFLMIQLLVYTSCSTAKLTAGECHDGIGLLRQSWDAKASRLRIGQILACPVLRTSLKESLYSIPSLIYNMAENNHKEFLTLLNLGIFPGVLEMTDQQYALSTLKMMTVFDLKELSYWSTVDIIKACCHALEHPTWMYQSTSSDKEIQSECKNIVASLMCQKTSTIKSILEFGIKQRDKAISWNRGDAFGAKRIVLAYLLENVAGLNGEDLNELIILRWLEEWKSISDRQKFAKSVMDTDIFTKWASHNKKQNN